MPAKKKLLPLFLYIGIPCILGAAGYWFLTKKQSDKRPTVSTVQVTRGDVVMTVTASGELQPVNSVEVSSQVSGLIKEVLVDFNTPVKKGDILARLDPATYDQRLKQAEAEYASTIATNTLQKLNTNRTLDLYTKGLATAQERDQAVAQLAQSDASLMTRRAAVEDAKVNLSRCTIYAPIDGVVMQRAADAGKTVAASLNAPTLFIIANDLSKMQIVAAVAEADIGNIALDQTVNFRVDAYPNRQFKGKISQIRNYPKTAQNVVTYETIIAVTNEELKLKPGMTANVEIIVSQRSGVLKIANSALRARVAEEYLVKKAKAANEAGTVPAPKTLSREEQRKVMGEIFQQVGYSRESGAPPSPEMSTKIQQLAKEKGIEFDPSRFGSGRSGRSAEKTGEQTITQRTVFRQKAPEAKQVEIEAIQIKTGITDGMTTEIIEGVNEGEQLVTNIVVADEASSSKATNPMMPSFGGRSR